MWNLNKLTTENLLSIEKIEYEFQSNRTVLVVGENKDIKKPKKSNGAGKTSFLEGICIALLNEPFRDLSLKEMIRRGEEECNITLSLTNSAFNKQLEIKRFLSVKKSSKSELWENGVLNTKLIDSDDVTKRILELLDITKEDLLNYFLISKDSYKSFFLNTDGKKKDLIARFSNANLVDGFIVSVKKEVEEKQVQISALDLVISKLQGRKELYEEQIAEFDVEEIKAEKQKRIDDVQTEKSANRLAVKGIDEKISTANKKIKQIQLDKKKIQYKDIELDVQTKKTKLQLLTSSKKESSTEKQELESIKAEIETKLAGIITCPHCSQDFVLDEDFSIKAGKETLIEVEQAIKEIIISHNLILQNIDSKDKEITTLSQKINNLKREFQDLENQEKIENSSIVSFERQKSLFEKQIKEYDVKIDTIKAESEELNPEIKISLDTVIKEIQVKEFDKHKLEQEKMKINSWEVNFKRFKTYLTNQSLKVIQGYVNYYLQYTDIDLGVIINGQRDLATKGKTKEEIEILATRNGESIGKFTTLSGGEKVTVDVCGILTNQKLINLNAKTGGLNILILDEIIESVDSAGVEEILKLLTKTEQTVLLITHAGNDISYQPTLKFVKHKGITQIND